MFETVIFDLDGVILDSMPFHVRAWKEAFARYGYKVQDKDLYLNEGAIEADGAGNLIYEGEKPLSAESFNSILRLQQDIFCSKYAAKVKTFDAVPQLFNTLKEKGLALGLVTSSHRDVLCKSLDAELARYFRVMITGDQVTHRKPHPEPYLRAVDDLLVPSDRCVVVENAPAGIRAAKAAGLMCVALTTTLEAEHLKEADRTFSSWKSLEGFLLTR